MAECLDLPVVTQAPTLDELANNIREAIGLHLEGKDLAAHGTSSNPTIKMTVPNHRRSTLPASTGSVARDARACAYSEKARGAGLLPEETLLRDFNSGKAFDHVRGSQAEPVLLD